MSSQLAQPSRSVRYLGNFFGALLVAVMGYTGYWLRRQNQELELREQELLPAIQAAAERNGLSTELVRSVVWKESRFDPRCVGTKGEAGLMQITDGAVQDWARVTRQPCPSRAELFHPGKNLDIGCWYLARCRSHWDGYASQEILQLAEYNAGRTKVLKDWAPEKPETPISLEDISYPGTRSYVRQILERCEHYRTTPHDNSGKKPDERT